MLKGDLLALLQRDTEAFDDASKAFKMPKETDEQKKARAEAVEAGLKKATEVPLSIMEKGLEVSRLAQKVLKKGTRWRSPTGRSRPCSRKSAAIGGMINVRINFSWMKDKKYVASIEKRLGVILEEARKIREEAVEYTLKKLGA